MSPLDPPLDYAAVGLISGLEVHQQLLTDRKLFCHCPAGRYTRTHDGTVLRHMRPTLSELGVYDGTALMEFKTRKHIIYLLNRENTCTYEMDDTPPFPVNQGALDVAIEQCLMLGCDIVDEVHIARKQYLDGSIPTGFQRTAIVGVNGKLPFRGRALSITQVSVEEDSCREVSDKGHLIVWRTDRLGMPLIETVTGPDLRTPDEVEEAILLVGRVCRSTRHVRVGMGASRQDVNVSVRGGRRVEIKGVPKAGWAPRLVHGEAWRQVNLLRLRDELHRRGIRTPDDVRVETTDVTGFVGSSSLAPLRSESWEWWVRSQGRRPQFELGLGPFRVLAVRLPGLAGTLGWPTQPGRTFGDELAGRVRVIAGLDQPPILFHSEGWPREAGEHLARLRANAGCEEADGLVLVWGPERDVHTAADEIRLRYVDATDGVPNETRQPFADGIDRLRADPARARPHVPGHRLPAHAGRPRARRPAPRLAPRAPVGSRRALPRGGRAPPRRPLPRPPRRRRPRGPGGGGGGRRPALRRLLLRRAAEGACGGPGWRSTSSPRTSGSSSSTHSRRARRAARPGRSWSAGWRIAPGKAWPASSASWGSTASPPAGARCSRAGWRPRSGRPTTATRAASSATPPGRSCTPCAGASPRPS